MRSRAVSRGTRAAEPPRGEEDTTRLHSIFAQGKGPCNQGPESPTKSSQRARNLRRPAVTGVRELRRFVADEVEVPGFSGPVLRLGRQAREFARQQLTARPTWLRTGEEEEGSSARAFYPHPPGARAAPQPRVLGITLNRAKRSPAFSPCSGKQVSRGWAPGLRRADTPSRKGSAVPRLRLSVAKTWAGPEKPPVGQAAPHSLRPTGIRTLKSAELSREGGGDVPRRETGRPLPRRSAGIGLTG
jgi:hypothetical protein